MKLPVRIIRIAYLLFTTVCMAQEALHTVGIVIPEVALLSVKSINTGSVDLKGVAPSEAGVAVLFTDQNNEMWLNYSSIVGATTEPSRSISVQLSEGDLPQGLALSVTASKDVGMGDGDLGSPVQKKIRISQNPKVIIKSIGSSYTGKGIQKGHNLSYALTLLNEKNAYAKLDFDASTSLSITYTLSDN